MNNTPDKRAYTPKEITDVIEWAQIGQKYGDNNTPWDLLVEVLDDALELANSRQDEIEQHEREEEDRKKWMNRMGLDWKDPLKGTGFQPDEEEDRRTATIVTDSLGER